MELVPPDDLPWNNQVQLSTVRTVIVYIFGSKFTGGELSWINNVPQSFGRQTKQ